MTAGPSRGSNVRPNTPDPSKPLRSNLPASDIPRSADATDRRKTRAGKDDEDALPIEDLPPRENVRGG
jgi:hypothetical protein